APGNQESVCSGNPGLSAGSTLTMTVSVMGAGKLKLTSPCPCAIQEPAYTPSCAVSSGASPSSRSVTVSPLGATLTVTSPAGPAQRTCNARNTTASPGARLSASTINGRVRANTVTPVQVSE